MRFQFVIIFRFMTHPLFLLFLVVGNLLMGNIANVFLSILGWLFINLIFGKSSYLYQLLKRERKKPEFIRELLEREKELEKKRMEEIGATGKKLAKLFEPAIKELLESEKENTE